MRSGSFILAWILVLSGCSSELQRVSESNENLCTENCGPGPNPPDIPNPPNPPGPPSPRFQKLIVSQEVKKGKNNYMGPFRAECPAGYTLTDGGYRLKEWKGGFNRPDSSYPHPSDQAWIAYIGDQNSDHSNNVWEIYALCLRDVKTREPIVRKVMVKRVAALSTTQNCPAGYLHTGGGARLLEWVGGSNTMDSVYPHDLEGQNHWVGGPRSGQIHNTWNAFTVCIKDNGYQKFLQEQVIARNGSVLYGHEVQCPLGTTLAGGGGGYELTAYRGGKNSMDAIFRSGNLMMYHIGGPNSDQRDNEWNGFAICLQ